jgi:putative LPS biosynthesis related polysaccharide transporter/flippase
MFVSFILYPLLIDLLGVEVYGTWLTIASISTWMTFFEFGLGSGLKNQLGRALANNNIIHGKELVSTAYFVIFIIVIVLSLIFWCIKDFINWNSLLGSSLNSENLNKFVSIMVSGFLLVFILKLVGNVASAHQDPFIEKLINTFISIGALITVSILLFLNITNIVSVSFWWTFSSVLVWIVFSFILYSKKYKSVRPEISLVNKRHFKSLIGIGLQFFVIQISLVIINGSTNFIISHYISASDVVIYNASYKLFSIANILYSIIIAPTWPAFVDAIEKNDIIWIKKTVNRMIKLWIGITLCMFIVLLFSHHIFNLWLSDKISIPIPLSILLFIYFTSLTFGGIFNMYINAKGKLRTQMLSWIIITILYIPIVIVLIKYTTMGIYSIAIGLIMSNIYYVIIAPIQYLRIIKTC